MFPPIPVVVCLIPVSANARVEGHVSHQGLCLLQTQESTCEKLWLQVSVTTDAPGRLEFPSALALIPTLFGGSVICDLIKL